MVGVFFFFKQKTAYEISSRDWSSDVCSSDLEAMERLIGGAVSAGARLHTGGRRIGTQGYYYAPTVLSEIPLSTAIMNEEPFGPVALVNSLRTEEEMIAEANRLPYGLAAYS